LHHERTHTSHDHRKKVFDGVMYAVGIIAPFFILPQALQIFTSKSTAGVSLPTWFLMGIVALLWCIYGIVHKEKPLIISNGLLFLFNFLVVIAVLINR